MQEFGLFDDDGELIRKVNKDTAGATLMKQGQMFERDATELETEYTSKIEAPIYHPKNQKPNILMLCDKTSSQRALKDIMNSNVTELEKKFLIDAAQRMNVFNYELIADYYAHSNAEMQQLMEKLALVIIDFDKAIELGFVQLSNDIKAQYLEYYDK